MKKLNIDIETYSDISLDTGGVYKYVESPNFKIQLFGVSVDEGPVTVYDLEAGDKVPQEILDALTDDSVEKHAFNASFERICLSRFLGLPTGSYLNPKNWHCSRVLCLSMGLPQSLASAGLALNITHQKLEEGHDLVLFFSKPDRKGNKHLPADYPEKWEQYKAYNKRDVEAEMEIAQTVGTKLPIKEQNYYEMDQQINDSGVRIDLELCNKALEADDIYSSTVITRLSLLTGLENPRSQQQFLPWLNAHLIAAGLDPVPNLRKETLATLKRIHKDDLTEELTQALELKEKATKTSTKKYQKMIDCACSDGRVRGLFQFMGASKTGRFAGRLLQLQNLTKNHEPNILEIREDFLKEGYDGLAKHGDVSDLLSQLVRSTIIPDPGKVFIDADYSAIEARVLAWLAGEQWRLDSFAEGKDIYCASASQMFKVPVVKNGVNGELRQKGKVAELACGYGGSVAAMDKMGGAALGLSQEEMAQIVSDWREASPNITKFWSKVDRAIVKRLKIEKFKDDASGRELAELNKFEVLHGAGNCTMGIGLLTKPTKNYTKPDAVGNEILIRLPSGRNLIYPNAVLTTNRFGNDSIAFNVTEKGRTALTETYGAKIVENITQATARDLLCNTMYTISQTYGLDQCRLVGHIHDEILAEVPIEICKEVLDNVLTIMSTTPDWCQGVAITADGYLSPCMLKDGFDEKPFLETLDKQIAELTNEEEETIDL